MTTKTQTPQEYIAGLPEERKQIVSELRKVILKNLPAGFKEEMNYGMLGYVVPHTVFPEGYHCNPDQPLPFMNLASQKNYIALYHMGLYADKEMLDWFQTEYQKTTGSKPDMGKSCIRFKKPETIPVELIGKLASKMTPLEWIHLYEKNRKK